ncbi:MAG: DNA polymerase IV, partial [Desulfovibrionaceae bacterium]|nr:DNA polymerase IV [Desulfovibrionaceae bacterium]
MHIDMDAFYASIEQLDHPELRGRPLVVGTGKRGVVSTASYEARRFGIHSAMPVGEARRLCPHAVFIPPRMRRYMEMAQRIRAVLREFSPLVEAASIDEAYLDATGLERLFGPVENMGLRLKEAVRRASGGLTCSVGIAPVKFLAKISSDMRKPDGLFMLRPEDVADFVAGLDVSRIPGVGKKFAAALASVGVRKAGDALRYPREFWERRYGKAGVMLYERARGKDSRQVVPFTPPKSESAETTFEEDTRDRDVLRGWLLRHAERVGRSLRRRGLAGRTVTLKIKYADFRQITRQATLPARTCSTDTIYEEACKLLAALSLEGKVRLIGLGVSGFSDVRPHHLSLLDAGAELNPAHVEERRTKLDGALDALRERYGAEAVVRGRL